MSTMDEAAPTTDRLGSVDPFCTIMSCSLSAFLVFPWSTYDQIAFETWPAINVFFH